MSSAPTRAVGSPRAIASATAARAVQLGAVLKAQPDLFPLARPGKDEGGGPVARSLPGFRLILGGLRSAGEEAASLPGVGRDRGEGELTDPDHPRPVVDFDGVQHPLEEACGVALGPLAGLSRPAAHLPHPFEHLALPGGHHYADALSALAVQVVEPPDPGVAEEGTRQLGYALHPRDEADAAVIMLMHV